MILNTRFMRLDTWPVRQLVGHRFHWIDPHHSSEFRNHGAQHPSHTAEFLEVHGNHFYTRSIRAGVASDLNLGRRYGQAREGHTPHFGYLGDQISSNYYYLVSSCIKKYTGHAYKGKYRMLMYVVWCYHSRNKGEKCCRNILRSGMLAYIWLPWQ